MTPETVPATRITPARRALLLTLLVFVLPILIGGGLFVSGWRPEKTANHGDLILPPKPAPVAALGEGAKGKWLLVIAGDSACATECAALAEQVRKVQVSLNREMLRIHRVLLVAAESPELADLRKHQPDLQVQMASGECTALLQAGPRHRLFVVDPEGNLMMQYAPDAEAKGIRADLERLLKFSWIG